VFTNLLTLFKASPTAPPPRPPTSFENVGELKNGVIPAATILDNLPPLAAEIAARPTPLTISSPVACPNALVKPENDAN
jgi:hypothetical protein